MRDASGCDLLVGVQLNLAGGSGALVLFLLLCGPYFALSGLLLYGLGSCFALSSLLLCGLASCFALSSFLLGSRLLFGGKF